MTAVTDAAVEDTHPDTVSQSKGEIQIVELDVQVHSGGRQAIDHNRNHSQRRNKSNRHNRHHSNRQLKKRPSLGQQGVSGTGMITNGSPHHQHYRLRTGGWND